MSSQTNWGACYECTLVLNGLGLVKLKDIQKPAQEVLRRLFGSNVDRFYAKLLRLKRAFNRVVQRLADKGSDSNFDLGYGVTVLIVPVVALLDAGYAGRRPAWRSRFVG